MAHGPNLEPNNLSGVKLGPTPTRFSRGPHSIFSPNWGRSTEPSLPRSSPPPVKKKKAVTFIIESRAIEVVSRKIYMEFTSIRFRPYLFHYNQVEFLCTVMLLFFFLFSFVSDAYSVYGSGIEFLL